jgi:hypothetical protein
LSPAVGRPATAGAGGLGLPFPAGADWQWDSRFIIQAPGPNTRRTIDQSGNGVDGIQLTAGLQPGYQGTNPAYGNQPSFDYIDGTAQYLDAGALGQAAFKICHSGVGSFTWFGFRAPALPAANRSFFTTALNANQSGCLYQLSSTGALSYKIFNGAPGTVLSHVGAPGDLVAATNVGVGFGYHLGASPEWQIFRDTTVIASGFGLGPAPSPANAFRAWLGNNAATPGLECVAHAGFPALQPQWAGLAAALFAWRVQVFG